jgi:hypothetical protein
LNGAAGRLFREFRSAPQLAHPIQPPPHADLVAAVHRIVVHRRAELCAVAERLGAELRAIPAAAVAQVGGVKNDVTGVKNGVKMDVGGCSQV